MKVLVHKLSVKLSPDVFCEQHLIACKIKHHKNSRFAHSVFNKRRRMMLSRAVNNFIRRELSGTWQGYQNILARSFTSSSTYLHSNAVSNTNSDVIIKSPIPPLSYPESTIDQYVWESFTSWSNKTAVVREADKKKTPKNKNFPLNSRLMASQIDQSLIHNCAIFAEH
jgi:hypothetical protein